MRILKHLTTWLLLLPLFLASGVVSGKVASGPQNPGWTGHQAETTSNPLWHQAKIDYSYGGASGSPVVAKSANIKVLGRLEDTNVARNWDGHDVLNIKGWTIKKNDQWVERGIKNKQEFYTASPTKGNLWDKAANRETVFSRELNQIKDAGYIKRGDSYIHPDNL